MQNFAYLKQSFLTKVTKTKMNLYTNMGMEIHIRG